jgi:hypothetical protein
MQVSELSEIPEGTLGFSVPEHEYGKTRSDTDPYEVIHTHLESIGLENDPEGLAIETYRFDEPGWPDRVDVFIPIKRK